MTDLFGDPTPEPLGTMRAITLWRPWPWVIVHGGKRIENRPWRFPPKLIGKVIALHSGKKLDHDRHPLIVKTLGHDVPEDAFTEGIVGTARVVDCVDSTAILDGLGLSSAWWLGPYGWLLEDVRALPEPIEIRGAQGLWRVPLSVQERIEGAS